MKLRPIKNKKKITAIFEKGRVINSKNMSVRVLDLQDEKPGYVVSVPKKNFPLAVNRNLLKRRMRTAIARLIKPSNDFSFFLIYLSKKTLSVSGIIEDCEKLFTRV